MQKLWYGDSSKISIIIQARLGSTRFPRKMLADICGKTMLERVIDRIKMTGIKKIVLAIPDTSSDRQLALVGTKCKIRIFLGSETDVLDRFYWTAETYRLDNIVRITGDCPLIDPQVINDTTNFFLNGKYDYVYNGPNVENERPYPDGMDTEVFKFEVLDKTWREATSQYDREHVTPYIYTHPEQFRIGYLQYKTQLPKFHWSVDRPEDLGFVRRVYSVLGSEFTLEDLTRLVGENKNVYVDDLPKV